MNYAYSVLLMIACYLPAIALWGISSRMSSRAKYD